MVSVAALAAYLLLGVAAGVLAGMLGVGGGLVIVPVLLWLFALQGFDGGVVMHLAVGTSLATIVFTSLSSIRAHHRRGAVLWPVVAQLTPGVILGAWLGAAVANLLPTSSLRTLFAGFELLVAGQMAFEYAASPHRQLPGRFAIGGVGLCIGTVSAVVGIGGGTLTVPFLTWCNVAMRNAVATSAACGLPIALAGAIGFVVSGWHHPALPAASSGYLYWPALFGIALTSMLFAPLGARLAHTLPVRTLKRFFALFLALLGIRLLLA
ncbi:MAG TPA: sulfite exporter TauE/SafE family protein [Gammaproteobacteria bacterium]